jgi:hypothetical protein
MTRSWLPVSDRPCRFPWIAPVIGLTLAGLGFFTIFQAALNYLVDTFQRYAASAVAANSEFSLSELHCARRRLTRCSIPTILFCWSVSIPPLISNKAVELTWARFPLIVTPLYHNVGVPWGTSIFAFFSVLLIPVPFFFFTYGKRIRMRSKWSRF